MRSIVRQVMHIRNGARMPAARVHTELGLDPRDRCGLLVQTVALRSNGMALTYGRPRVDTAVTPAEIERGVRGRVPRD